MSGSLSAGLAGGRWYAVAVVLHLAAAAVIWLTPLRVALGISPEKKPSMVESMSSHEIRQVGHTVEQATVARLKQQLERLDSIRSEMEQLKQQRLNELAQNSPRPAADPQASVEAMRKAVEAMQQNAEAMESGKALQASEPNTGLDEIDRHLDEATAKLPQLEEPYRPVLSALDQTRGLQDRARQAWAQSDGDGDRQERARREEQSKVEEHKAKLAEADKKDQQVVERRARVEEEQTRLANLTRQREGEKDERQLKRLDDQIRQQESRIADRKRQVEQYAAKATEYRQSIQSKAEAAGAAQQQLDTMKLSESKAKEAAVDWQRQAMDSQKRAISLMERAMSGGATQDGPAEPRPETLAQAYARALRREQEITESYKMWRAAELAMLREIPLGEAMRQTDIVRSERPQLDVASAEAPESANALAQRKGQLESVLRETGSMVTLSETLLRLTRQQATEHAEGHTIALDRERMAQQTRLASVDISGRIADTTSAGGAGNPGTGSGSGGSGGPGGTGGGDGSGNGGGNGGAGDGMGGQGSGTGAGGGSLEARFRDGPGSGFTPPQEVRPGQIDAFERKISPAGEPARWMSLGSWYLIGPFANPSRSNINRQFPPESAIDLDATYIGKDNRIIRWEYHPAEHIHVTPRNEEPYGIWYATTEVWSDRDRDVWAAMGSDDQGRLWVNGQLVWISASRHKDWTIGEAFRRIHLAAGRNRLLYRIENGHGGLAFSLCLRLEDQSQ
jgi:hypothetical protein